MKVLICLISILAISCGKKVKNEKIEKDYTVPKAGEYREYLATEDDFVRIQFPKYLKGIKSGYGKVFDFYRRYESSHLSVHGNILESYYSFDNKPVKKTLWQTKEKCLENINCNEIEKKESEGFRSYIGDPAQRFMSFLDRTFYFSVSSSNNDYTTKFSIRIECTTEIETFERDVYCKEDQFKIKLKIFEFIETTKEKVWKK
jgi:hypothetical protein